MDSFWTSLAWYLGSRGTAVPSQRWCLFFLTWIHFHYPLGNLCPFLSFTLFLNSSFSTADLFISLDTFKVLYLTYLFLSVTTLFFFLAGWGWFFRLWFSPIFVHSISSICVVTNCSFNVICHSIHIKLVINNWSLLHFVSLSNARLVRKKKQTKWWPACQHRQKRLFSSIIKLSFGPPAKVDCPHVIEIQVHRKPCQYSVLLVTPLCVHSHEFFKTGIKPAHVRAHASR